MSDWQPIETAPEDQTVLGYRPDRIGRGGRVCVMRFDDGRFTRRPRPFWKTYHGGLGVQHDRDNPPTHWMPFPAAPVAP